MYELLLCFFFAQRINFVSQLFYFEIHNTLSLWQTLLEIRFLIYNEEMLTYYTFYKLKGLNTYYFIQADFSYSSFSDSKCTFCQPCRKLLVYNKHRVSSKQQFSGFVIVSSSEMRRQFAYSVFVLARMSLMRAILTFCAVIF